MKLASVALVGAMCLAGVASAQAPLYPDISDNSHASTDLVDQLRDFFTVKSKHDADALMAHFANDPVFYNDATSGGSWPTRDALDKVFHAFLPKAKPEALSYPTRILGDKRSALVAFTDTPELFGRELRILGAVSFDANGKIVRWMDYWDGRSSHVKNTLKPTYPTDFHDDVGNATGKIDAVARKLGAAFAASDAGAATAMLAYDAVYEDMALHAQILGRLAIGRYLTRALAKVPYGKDAAVAHTVGSDQGGGYEWKAPAAFPLKRGNTAIALDTQGQITQLTVVYDSSLLPDDDYHALVALSAEE
jgi:ketosteroid isomerase-like protein